MIYLCHSKKGLGDTMLKPSRFLDPKTDVVFKKIFGNNVDLIKSFLNSILPLPEPIETLEYLTPEQSPRIPTMKNTIVDVKCKDKSGRIFIVEMQMQWSDSFTKRLLFGASRAYVQQLMAGEDYQSLCPVYGLGIINAIFDQKSDEWFHHYKTINVKNHDKILSGLELVFLELPKFKPATWQDKKMGALWLRFLQEVNEQLTEVPKEFSENPSLVKAMELAQEAAYTPLELEAYDRYWDAVRVESTVRKDAREEGWEEGREEGRRDERVKIIKNLLLTGMPVDQVAFVMKLSIEHIKAVEKLIQ